VTRAYPLWALFGVVAVSCALLAHRRGVAWLRLLAAWAFASALLWVGAGALGFLGGLLHGGLDVRGPRDMVGFSVGAPLGALAGALLGIALSERLLRKAWPRWQAIALSGGALVVVAALVLFILRGLAQSEQQAGRSVLVVFPLLGAAPVLGWLIGERT
jgi:hypothetical protein